MSEGRSRQAVVAALAGFPSRLRESAVAAADRPVPLGEWGPAEVVRHLIACEIEVHHARLVDLATQEAPVWGWTEPAPWAGEPDLTLPELLDRFDTLRAATVATVGAIDDAGWRRSGTHERLGRWDVEGLLRNAIDHDEEHLAGLG